MKRPAYTGKGKSSPLPISWSRRQYSTGVNDIVKVNPEISMGDSSMSMRQFVERVYESDSLTARKIWGDEPFELKNAIRRFVLKEGIPEEYKDFVANLPACLPSDTLYLKVDKEAVIKSGIKIPKGKEIPDYMEISLKGQGHVTKGFMMLLEVLAQSNFSRPLYVSTGIGKSVGNLYRHFMLEGMAYRITPFVFEENESYHIDAVDTDKMYDAFMNKFHYGNVSKPGIYLDETIMKMCQVHRRMISTLVTKLIEEGKHDKALKILAKCDKELPSYNIPHNALYGSLDIAAAYLQCGDIEKGKAILEELETRGRSYLEWYGSLPEKHFNLCADDYEYELRVLYGIEKVKESLKTKRHE